MATVQGIAFAFDYSSMRLQAFLDELDENQAAIETMEKNTKLKKTDGLVGQMQ